MDYLSGSNVISRVLISGRQEGQSGKGEVTMEAKVGVVGGGGGGGSDDGGCYTLFSLLYKYP